MRSKQSQGQTRLTEDDLLVFSF